MENPCMIVSLSGTHLFFRLKIDNCFLYGRTSSQEEAGISVEAKIKILSQKTVNDIAERAFARFSRIN